MCYLACSAISSSFAAPVDTERGMKATMCGPQWGGGGGSHGASMTVSHGASMTVIVPVSPVAQFHEAAKSIRDAS